MSMLLQVRGGPDRVVEVRDRAHQEGEAIGGAEGAHARTGDTFSTIVSSTGFPRYRTQHMSKMGRYVSFEN